MITNRFFHFILFLVLPLVYTSPVFEQLIPDLSRVKGIAIGEGSTAKGFGSFAWGRNAFAEGTFAK